MKMQTNMNQNIGSNKSFIDSDKTFTVSDKTFIDGGKSFITSDKSFIASDKLVQGRFILIINLNKYTDNQYIN